MIVVLDVSAAVEILMHGADSARLERTVTEADWIYVPALYTSELVNVVWKYHRFSGLPLARCEKAIAQGLELPDVVCDDRDLQREAFAMACSCRRPAYDMFYLVLARRHAARLLTLDRSLRTLAAKHDVVAE